MSIMARAEKIDFTDNIVINETKTAVSDYLAFGDHKGVTDKLSSRLGDLNKTCINVTIGSGYKDIVDTEFEVGAMSQDNCDKVIDHVNSRGKLEGLVFGRGLDLVSNENITAEAI